MAASKKLVAWKKLEENISGGIAEHGFSYEVLNVIDQTTWLIFVSNLQYNGESLAHADCTRLAELLDTSQIAKVLADFGVTADQFERNYGYVCIAGECTSTANIYCDPSECHSN